MRQAPRPETTLIHAAQALVDQWLHSNKRGPFDRAVREAERSWSEILRSDIERAAFRRVANAIRVGKGHARANPMALMRIARDTICAA